MLSELESLSRGLDVENQVSRFELAGYMRHMLLRDADVFGMDHPLEVRAPMLDHRVVELAARCPGVWKRPDPRAKPLLLDAVGDTYLAGAPIVGRWTGHRAGHALHVKLIRALLADRSAWRYVEDLDAEQGLDGAQHAAAQPVAASA